MLKPAQGELAGIVEKPNVEDIVRRVTESFYREYHRYSQDRDHTEKRAKLHVRAILIWIRPTLDAYSPSIRIFSSSICARRNGSN